MTTDNGDDLCLYINQTQTQIKNLDFWTQSVKNTIKKMDIYCNSEVLTKNDVKLWKKMF